MKDTLTNRQYYFLCFLLGLIACSVTFFFWPGFMSPDAQGQLAQAISGQYSDENPPLTSMYWRLWLWWRQGPEPILLTYLALLFSSAYVLLYTLKRKRISTIIPFIPLIPHILLYSGSVWKDVGFAFSYLFASAFLTKSYIKNSPLSLKEVFIIFLVLFYGTSIKYQGIFVLPIMSLWFACRLKPKSSFITKSLIALSLWTSIVSGHHLVTKILVTNIEKSHYWQRVKLFDLAGISVRKNEDLFPKFIQEKSYYSFDNIRETYDPFRVDELMLGHSPKGCLVHGKTQEERDILWNTWFKAVKDYPLLYLKHRFAVWKKMVYNSPMKSLNELKSVDALPPTIKHTLKLFEDVLSFIKEATRFIYYIPLIFIYLILGFLYMRKNPSYALPLIFMNIAGLSLMGVLFIFSMASDLRYIYLTMVFLHFSHPLAWGTVFYGNQKKST
jgi:hypothetical protein